MLRGQSLGQPTSTWKILDANSGPKGLNKDCGPLLVSFILIATFYGVRMAELREVKQLARVISDFISYLFGFPGKMAE